MGGKAQVDFHLAPSQLLYVSYNRGVKGGGFTAPLFPATIANLNDLSFKPEELTSYELGLQVGVPGPHAAHQQRRLLLRLS